jgi:hypothetical protein
MRLLVAVAAVCLIGLISGSAIAIEPLYSVTASADEISPGETVSFSTDAPGDNYAQIFLDYVDGEPSPVRRGTVAALTADLAWEEFRSTNWYNECTPGRIILRVYDVKEADTVNFFIGILMYDQVLEGVPADAEVPVILAAGECPSDTTSTTTILETTIPTTTVVPTSTPTVLPDTGPGPPLLLAPAILALAGGWLAVRASRRSVGSGDGTDHPLGT